MDKDKSLGVYRPRREANEGRLAPTPQRRSISRFQLACHCNFIPAVFEGAILVSGPHGFAYALREENPKYADELDR